MSCSEVDPPPAYKVAGTPIQSLSKRHLHLALWQKCISASIAIAVVGGYAYAQVEQGKGKCRGNAPIASIIVRATAYRVAGYPHRALTELRHAIEQDSTCGDLWLLLAQAYYDAGDVASSIAAAYQALAFDSTLTEAYSLLADALALRDPPKASYFALRAWEINPTLSNQLRAAYLLRTVDTVRAISLLREVFERTSAEEVANELVALCLSYRDTTQAIALLRRLLFEYPEAVDVARALSSLYVQREQWDSAWYFVRYAFYHMETLDVNVTLREWLATLRSGAPANLLIEVGSFLQRRADVHPEYLIQVARMLSERHLWNAAQILIEEAILHRKVERAHAIAAMELAAQYNSPAYADLLLSQRDSVWHDSWIPALRLHIARTYGTYSLAEQERLAHLALARDSSDSYALFYAAYFAHTAGLQERALEFYNRLVFFEPDNAAAANNLAYLLAERGERLGYALELAQRALDSDSTNPSFLDTYGWILYKLGRYREAGDYLERAVAHSPHASATLFEHLGDNYSKLGVVDRARYWWRRALDADPTRLYLRSRLR
ncbi:MAG: tetratricopeptide repeat protein [Chlorobi bacterium]|nr:tetratricopeptide repeat protein [Chlorobiota bacterium]